jgi:glycosyltransferase involved in cell wall biosynthesis
VLLSIVIKCFNEEANVARAIESALEVTRVFGGEVIVADSLSVDRTVEIASSYPITVVQLARSQDRSCGAAAQLGAQYASGDFIYLMDGDMALAPSFILYALEFLIANKTYGGVAGRLVDMHTANEEFELRSRRAERERPIGDVDRLDGGGLYRTGAIRTVGYFTDLNLRSFEELELGSRLRSKGWKLARIDHLAIEHYGYNTVGGYTLLVRRWQTKYAYGIGQLLRTKGARSNPLKLIRSVRLFSVAAFVYSWLSMALMALLLIADGWGVLVTLAIIALPIVVVSVRSRSLRLGLYSVSSWMVNSAGLIAGVFYPRLDPSHGVASRLIYDHKQQPAEYA